MVEISTNSPQARRSPSLILSPLSCTIHTPTRLLESYKWVYNVANQLGNILGQETKLNGCH